MLIEKVAIIDSADQQNYNMELFMEYLAYQMLNLDVSQGKWSYEEYVALMELRYAKLYPDSKMKDFYTDEHYERYVSWMGFESKELIPDYCSFIIYCKKRDLNPFNSLARKN